jgi:type 1 glutamine amidotransferase
MCRVNEILMLMAIVVLAMVILHVPVTDAKAGAPAKPPSEATLEKVKAALPDKPIVKPAQPRKLLVYTRSTGFYHTSIPLAAKTLEIMGQKTGAFEATISDDPEMLKPANLVKFDGFCSDNCVGAMSNDPEVKKGILDFVSGGKGWIGTHASNDVSAWRYPEYEEMIGSVFAAHPWNQTKISVKLDDPGSPINAAFDGKGFTISDEIYTFTMNPYSREKLHVLLSMDWDNSHLRTNVNPRRADNDYALAWIREYGKGRVFYNAFGHIDDVFWNEPLMRHYLAGIQYALGDLKADATPSAKLTIKAAPGPDLAAPAAPPAAPAEKPKDAAESPKTP